MALFNVFDIAGSAMAAQELRLNTTASNLANAESVSSSTGAIYRARHPVFAQMIAAFDMDDSVVGVRVLGIVESQKPARREYSPDHVLADEQGYIYRPNVNVVEEMANMISASRSYQTNVEVLNTTKQMLLRTLAMGQ